MGNYQNEYLSKVALFMMLAAFILIFYSAFNTFALQNAKGDIVINYTVNVVVKERRPPPVFSEEGGGMWADFGIEKGFKVLDQKRNSIY